MSALVLHVRLHDGRYHGEGDWPPSPARLFQALVAGAGLGGPIGDAERKALEWLEVQEAPLVAAPPVRRPRRGVLFYMPNNDSDAIAGDPLRMPKIRTATKIFQPYLFDATVPFVYAWPLAGDAADDGRARAICSLVERLYQLGRGIDMAWAWGEVLDNRDLDGLLARHPGHLFRPSAGSSTTTLPSPCPGSLESIERRYRAFGERFRYVEDGKTVKVVFRRPPGPRFHLVSYDSPPSRQLYELRDPTAKAAFAPWPLTRMSSLVVRLRDGAAERLNGALPARKAEIERVLVGRKPDGTNDGPPEHRVRIIPLPSIGHVHADREIRRVLIEVPPTCPVSDADVHWAFSGLDVADIETGEIQAVFTRTDDEGFLRHYAVDDRRRVWRTVTPAALPEDARRRRIDPARKRDEAKAGPERAMEQARAAAAVCQALRHAGVRAGVESIRVQREPFDANGARVEAFAGGTRFVKERLWHVELAFEAPVSGPLVIGDGRFLGLGVMAPIATLPGFHVFAIESGLIGAPNPEHIARALRRAVMARVQAVLDDTPLPAFFSGHQPDGGPARAEQSSHLAFLCDLPRSRLIVVAPHALDRRDATREEREHLADLDEALENMRELRAGPAGHLLLRRTWMDPDRDLLTAPSREWESLTSYVVTRHARLGDASAALTADLVAECRRRGLPHPSAAIALETEGVPGTGLCGRARLEFSAAVKGPVLLGRNRHFGGGLFLAALENAAHDRSEPAALDPGTAPRHG
jgi:CRISPR-associated protein Csb2